MLVQTFIKRSRLPFPAETVFDWHTRPGALERLTPPWENVEIVSQTNGIGDGARAELRVRIGPLRRRWIAEHRGCVHGRQFQDVQIQGPFHRWEHTHRFIPDGADSCILEDRIEYVLPLGRLGRLLGARISQGMLVRMFNYRHQITAADLAVHERFRRSPPMKVLISG
ncbi:MAG: SRPBCC family protein, partial [Planctomycetaceae bacterium]